MFRLDKQIGEKRARFSIAGEISAEWIGVLETSCDQAMKDGKTVDLVLNAITSIDEDGRRLLERLAAKGVCLSANGLYYSYLVDTIRRGVSPGNKDCSPSPEANNPLGIRLRQGD